MTVIDPETETQVQTKNVVAVPVCGVTSVIEAKAIFDVVNK